VSISPTIHDTRKQSGALYGNSTFQMKYFAIGDRHGFLAFSYLLAMPVLLTDHRKRWLLSVCLRMMREGERFISQQRCYAEK
jgi:hypothetical protein